MEIASLATLALGFIFVGSENGEITSTILQTLMEKAERGDIGLDEKWARFMALGLGLLYLGEFVRCADWTMADAGSRRLARRVGHDHRDAQGY
jgi:26S proteasome regulatory subunit N1